MPVFTRVFFYISFFRYAVFATMAGEAKTIGAESLNCAPEGIFSGCRDIILGQYGIDPDSQWAYLGGLIIVLIVARILAVIALKSIKHIRR